MATYRTLGKLAGPQITHIITLARDWNTPWGGSKTAKGKKQTALIQQHKVILIGHSKRGE